MWWDYRLTWYGACCANMALDQEIRIGTPFWRAIGRARVHSCRKVLEKRYAL